MPSFAERSKSHLEEADQRLRDIANEVIKHYDFAVIAGHRGEEAQNQAVHEGRSQKRWPQGSHNSVPSRAIDVAPLPIDWDSEHAAKKFSFLAGFFFGVAATKGVGLRWGGDWDGDRQMNDQKLHDLTHIELLSDAE
ncbi:M15 family peptidase [Candidatus Palauibacter sp.]|uniref:M15 family peptidase n=1 Tax=Candidatus Palauibacter sp. TaxID=3101350 RepID=UPI003B5BA496